MRLLIALLALPFSVAGQPLEGTLLLTSQGDLAAEMVAGIDSYLMRELAAVGGQRAPGSRERLRKLVGAVDARISNPDVELIATVSRSSFVGATRNYEAHLVRWPVFDGVYGEGLLLKPKQPAVMNVVALPDADQPPEQLAMDIAGRLAGYGCQVLVMTLIDRKENLSGNPAIGKTTKQPHREFIYRMAYEMGRHIIGYEVGKVQAAVDYFTRTAPQVPVGVWGAGEGGLIALYSAALDERISRVAVNGYSGPGPEMWREPIYRNVWSVLREFGAAGIRKLIEPRQLIELSGDEALWAFLGRRPKELSQKLELATVDAAARMERQFRQLVDHTQRVVRASDTVRQEFWKGKDTDTLRRYFHEEIIGALPPATEPMKVATRPTHDTPAFKGYDAVIPVWKDVFAYGVLLVPKDLKPGERRPVVVAQHGLEGRPDPLVDPRDARMMRAYQGYAARLCERGFVIWVPQNPYIFGEKFRVLVRKGHPLKLSLFSFIIGQHQRALDWIVTLPFVDAGRIAFYGLSYGGKTAMRVPPLEPRYKAVICSGDFNEWIWKITSYDAPFSYMYTIEYDMLEFDLGGTFNYSDLAKLIAPRPFMVERGHRDGVGIDEWIAYEFAKVRRHYADLGYADRAEIEFFQGPHQIWGQGTFAFLHRWLRWP